MPTDLPHDDHVARFVRKGDLRRDENGNVLGVLPQAFRRREAEEYLSATWLEHFAADYEEGLAKASAAIRRQLTVKPRDGFTVGHITKIVEICDTFSVNVRILHEPEPPENTGHCAIHGLPRDDLYLFSVLADDAFTDTRVAGTLPA